MFGDHVTSNKNLKVTYGNIAQHVTHPIHPGVIFNLLRHWIFCVLIDSSFRSEIFSPRLVHTVGEVRHEDSIDLINGGPRLSAIISTEGGTPPEVCSNSALAF